MSNDNSIQVEDAIRAAKDRPSMERELAELRAVDSGHARLTRDFR